MFFFHALIWFNTSGGQFLNNLALVVGHAHISHQEVVDLPLGLLNLLRLGCPPLALFQCSGRVDPPPGAHQGITTLELVSEPGHKAAWYQRVEPQRYPAQFHRHRVKIHPVDIVISQIELDALQVQAIFFRFQHLAPAPVWPGPDRPQPAGRPPHSERPPIPSRARRR